MYRPPSAVLAVVGQFPAHHADSGDISVLPENLKRRGHGHDLDALFPGLVHFPGSGRHLLLRPAVDHGDLLRAQTDSGSRHVHGRASASDHNQTVPDRQIAL